MTAATHITTEYYISTGRLNAMFTLRVSRSASGAGYAFDNDHYICNLAAAQNEELAIEKARDYFERMFDRMGGNTENHFIGFNDTPEASPRVRRGKMSARDTEAMERIEAGLFPFGKFAGQPITAATDGYIMYWVDQANKEGASVVALALAAACTGVALERDLIAKRQAARDERAALDALSQHIGTVGERRMFTGEIVGKFRHENYDADPFAFYIVTVRCGTDLIKYLGNGEMIECERGQVITFKATIKAHDDYKGVLSTKVARPKLAA